jgi:hypothetical protein
MANANGSIDEIIGQEARNQVQETTNLLKLMVDEFKVAVTQAKTLNTEISNAKGLAQMTTALEKMNITTAKATEATNKAAVAYEKLRQQEQITATKLEQTATQQAKTDKEKVNIEKAKLDLRLKEEAAAQKAIANLAKETKAAEIQASAYIKLRDAHKLAEKAALEAGVTYGKNSEQFKLAAAESNKLRDQFVGLHKELGNNRDNVGNYGSAISKVWGGIRQLAYILPGLGIAGIFNLAGEAIVQLFPQIEEFYNKIVNGNAEAKKAAKELSEDIGKQTGKFESLTRQLNDHNLSKEQHIRAAKELQELYPTALKNYSAEEIAAGKASEAIKLIGKALIAVSMARAAQADIDKNAAEKYSNEKNIDELKAKLILEKENQKIFLEQTKTINRNDNYYNLIVERANKSTNAISSMSSEIEKLTNRNNELENSMNKAANAIGEYDAAANAGGIKLDGNDLSKGKKKEKIIKEIEIHVKWIEDNLPSTGLSPATVKALGDAYKGMFESINDDIAAEYPQGLGDPEAAQLNLQLSEHANQKRIEADKNKIAEDSNKVRVQKTKEMLNAIVQITNDATSALSAISDAITERELLAIDKRDKALKLLYDNELRFIENSGFSSAEKEKQKQKLQAQTEAKQKQIDRDRVTALRKQAALNKALSIVNIIAKTAEAVMANLSIPGYGQIMAAVAAALGAAELAKVIATPLPQYAKGRKGGKAEHAIVGEIGQEAIVTTDGKVTLTPSTPSLAYIPQGADVIPHNELIKNSAYVALAKQGTVTTDKLQMALIAEFERNTEKIDELISVTKSKNLTATYNGLGGFESYKQANIR